MKKFILALVLSLGLFVSLPVAALADSAPPVTIVSGTVRKNGAPLNGANVTVACNSVSGSDTTDASGGYVVQFAAADCPDGATATATATKDSAVGSSSGQVGNLAPKLNVAVVDVNVALPEMGTIVGGIAALGAGGAFLIIRRKQQVEQL